MNYIQSTTEPININITTRAEMSQGETMDVTVYIKAENETSESHYDGLLTMMGYYTTLTINPNGIEEEGEHESHGHGNTLSLSEETVYNMRLKDENDNIIYKGKIFSTTQDKIEYKINNDNYTTTTSSGNDFLIFE